MLVIDLGFMDMQLKYADPWWIVSQVFAFLALIFMFWSFQIKNKIKMMLLLGIGSMFLAASASFLDNWSLAVLFGLAAVRNYVFCYLDWRMEKEKNDPKWIRFMFAGIFAVTTISATAILWPTGHSLWLEVLICVTLLGLITGNVLEGTHLIRVSFVLNRVFNIINHIHFNNAIAVIIASLTISSNIIFYIRQLVAWKKDNMIRQRKLEVLND